MSRDEKPAVVYLRMSRHLRDGLRGAADAAGCSLNAFAVQVLAAAAGDPARFREHDVQPAEAQEIKRDRMGYPLERAARWEHSVARGEYHAVLAASGVPTDECVAQIKQHDAEDPGFYVEWLRLRRTPGAT